MRLNDSAVLELSSLADPSSYTYCITESPEVKRNPKTRQSSPAPFDSDRHRRKGIQSGILFPLRWVGLVFIFFSRDSGLSNVNFRVVAGGGVGDPFFIFPRDS